jgi:hypothetical protein
MSRFDHAHRGQRAEAGAHRGTTYANLPGQIALGRQPIAGPQRSILNQSAHVRDHVPRAALGQS